MDWNFLLLLAGSFVIAGVAMAGGYFVGKHNAYVEMINDLHQQKLAELRRAVKELEERNMHVGSSSDH